MPELTNRRDRLKDILSRPGDLSLDHLFDTLEIFKPPMICGVFINNFRRTAS